MKKKDAVKELRGLDVEELKKRVSESENEIMNLRFRHAAGQLQQTAQFKILRKKVAQAKTLINEKMISEKLQAQ